MHATKEAILAREHNKKIKSTIFYIDLRASGKGFQEYVARGKEEYNIEYIRGRVAKISEDENQNPIIHYENTITSERKEMTSDLAVLATTLIPKHGTQNLSKILGIELDEYGFIKTRSYNPIDTTRSGIFTCGCCNEPMDIPESVVQASAAAERAAEIVVGRKIDE
jgi:heterodisulfide reductase subunit A